MIPLLITLLVYILVAGLLFWIITLIPLPAPWQKICQVIVAIILLIAILQWLLPIARTAHF